MDWDISLRFTTLWVIWTVLALTSSGKVALKLKSGVIVSLNPLKELAMPLGDQKYFYPYAGPYVERVFFHKQRT